LGSYGDFRIQAKVMFHITTFPFVRYCWNAFWKIWCKFGLDIGVISSGNSFVPQLGALQIMCSFSSYNLTLSKAMQRFWADEYKIPHHWHYLPVNSNTE